MPKINVINTAVYKLLKNDETLAGLCSAYKGSKRPGNVTNPSVTVDTKCLEAGQGEGIWMCDVVVKTYVDVLANRMADHETLENIVSQVKKVLVDTEIELEGAKALPLIEGESASPEWLSNHENETSQESIYGLIFIDFGENT